MPLPTNLADPPDRINDLRDHSQAREKRSFCLGDIILYLVLVEILGAREGLPRGTERVLTFVRDELLAFLLGGVAGIVLTDEIVWSLRNQFQTIANNQGGTYENYSRFVLAVPAAW